MEGQPLLSGFSCRDQVPPEVADDLGMTGKHYCDPNSETCCCQRSNPGIQRILVAVNGLQFEDLPNKVPIPLLPNAISTIPGDDGKLPFGTRQFGPALATRYTQIRGLLSGKPELAEDWRKLRYVPDHRLVLVHQETGDDKLESLFPATLRPAFFPAIKKVGNVVLVSPGYSVYDDGSMCEMHQDINLKRSLAFAVEANRAGISCIPSIGWDKNRPRQLERIAEWLERQGDKVTHLAVNAQMGSEALWADLASGMLYLEKFTGRRYFWLVFGGADALRVVYRRIHPTRVVHVSAAVPTYTLKHRLLGEKGTNDLPAEELLRQNLERESVQRDVAAIMAAKDIRAGRLL